MEVDEDNLSGTTPTESDSMNQSNDAGNTASVPSAIKMNSSKKVAAKQLAVRQKIERYFQRLTQGCRRENCSNPNCASNPSQKKLSVNEAAAKAIELLQQKAEICWLQSDEADSTRSSSSQNTSAPTIRERTGEIAMDTEDLHAVDSADPPVAMEAITLGEASDTQLLRKQDLKKGGGKVTKDTSSVVVKVKEVKYLTEEIIDQVLTECREEEGSRMVSDDVMSDSTDPYLPLFHRIAEVFSHVEGLNRSFVRKTQDESPIEDHARKDVEPEDSIVHSNKLLDTTDSSVTASSNSDVTLSSALASYLSNEGGTELSTQGSSGLLRLGAVRKKFLDKKKDSSPEHEVKVFSPTVDVRSVRRVYAKLKGIEQADKALVSSLELLAVDASIQLNVMRQLRKTTVHLNIFVTIMENPSLHSPEYLETALPRFCKAMAELPIEATAKLADWWSKCDVETLRQMVQCLQQLLTYKILQVQLNTSSENEQLEDLHGNEVVANTIKCLKILYYASLLGGKIDKEMDNRVEIKPSSSDFDALAAAVGLEEEEFAGLEKKVWKDPLSELLGVTDKDVIDPLIPAEEFQNELLNETFSVYSDFTNFMIDNRAKADQFTFMRYPFVLNTVSKTAYFFYDNKIQMLSGRRMMVLQSILHRSPISPYLRLKIRREHVIADSLVRLELISNENPQDLRKQLYVEFEDEQGVDEGGVSKEFFQLVVEKIFNPDYGMFSYNEDTHLFWFNAHSLENKAEFTLIGIVLGLAIYNSCILDIKFPTAVYKKLLGKKARFEDMKLSHPRLYSGLKQLLEYDGDVEEDMMATFSAEYQDMFGTQMKHELKPNGENIPVTKENRQEYVDLYADWILNQSISEQFNAFRYGFDLVVAKSPIKYLFRIDELEVLISGSQEYDFNSLESATEYDGGFEKDSQTVTDFWSVVHEMTEEDKKKLLQFTTGTDRAPVGGLAKIKLVIARNGPDSDRLPTAHTCFNVILLPDYKNREKLKERLYKAITHAKGFGML